MELPQIVPPVGRGEGRGLRFGTTRSKAEPGISIPQLCGLSKISQCKSLGRCLHRKTRGTAPTSKGLLGRLCDVYNLPPPSSCPIPETKTPPLL